MSGSELYVPPADGMPETLRDGFWFLVGWKWATRTAHENGWIGIGDAAALDSDGERLAEEAKRRREGEAT